MLSSTAAAQPPRVYSLKIGDHFAVAGAQIDCRIAGTASARRIPVVTCGLVRSGTSLPVPKSYSFSFGDRGVDVFGPGAKQQAVFRARSDPGVPLDDPAPTDLSSTARRVQLRPVMQGLQGVNVARSSVFCVAIAYTRPHAPSLNCTLSSRAIAKELGKPRLGFRPLTVTLSREWLRVWRMTRTRTQTIVFAQREPTG